MLVEKLYPTFVDTLCNVLPNLMRTSSFNHIQGSPPILGLGACRRAYKESVAQLALQVILFDVVCEIRRHDPLDSGQL
jgi:hypothetical protein